MSNITQRNTLTTFPPTLSPVTYLPGISTIPGAIKENTMGIISPILPSKRLTTIIPIPANLLKKKEKKNGNKNQSIDTVNSKANNHVNDKDIQLHNIESKIVNSASKAVNTSNVHSQTKVKSNDNNHANDNIIPVHNTESNTGNSESNVEKISNIAQFQDNDHAIEKDIQLHNIETNIIHFEDEREKTSNLTQSLDTMENTSIVDNKDKVSH